MLLAVIVLAIARLSSLPHAEPRPLGGLRQTVSANAGLVFFWDTSYPKPCPAIITTREAAHENA